MERQGSDEQHEHRAAIVPPDAESAIRRIAEEASPVEAALALAAIASRAIAELNKLARTEANSRRGQADWGMWASLGNAARDTVLKAATCRKVATDLARKAAEPSDG